MYEILIFLTILLFGSLSIYYDLKHRKISNYITFSFLLISLIIFILSVNTYNSFNLVCLFIIVILSIIIYSYKIWGAADGKIFIGLSMLFFAINNSIGTLNFFLNTIFLYAITMIIFSLYVTNKKSKERVFKKIRYLEHTFFSLIIFIFGALIYKYLFSKINDYYIIGISILIFIVLILSTNKIKKIFRKQKKKLNQIIIGGGFLILLILSNDTILNYFFLVLFIKILIDYISKLTLEIEENKKTYESPFSIYLFFGALLTLIIGTNLFLLIISLF